MAYFPAASTWGWPVWVMLALGTLLLANLIAAGVQRARFKRIEKKYIRLAQVDTPAAIPVTIITGFLGAGKTVLLNHILRNPGSERICVIENEVGAVSIDHELLAPSAGAGAAGSSDIVVLANGCMCCSATGPCDELERTLDRLLQVTGKPEARRATPTYIVIETSGLADPAPIIQTFFRSDISARFVLDSVVTVVDAKHIQYHVQPPSGNNVSGWAASVLAQHTEATRQIAYADTIILNKVDCVSSTELHTVSQLLGHLNPGARLIPATFGKVPVSSLLHTNSFDTHTYPLPIHCEDALGGTTEGPLAAARPPTVRATSHTHDKGVRAITLTSLVARRVLHVGDMRGWLTTLLQERWQDLFRVKGIFWAYDEADGDESTGPTAHVPRPFVIHGVHAELHGSFVDTAVDTAFRTDFQPAIVLIGRHLDGPALERALHDACNESSHELQRSLTAHGIHAVSPSPSSGACDQADTHCEGKECGHEHAHEHAGGHEDARSAARSMRQRRRATGAHGA